MSIFNNYYRFTTFGESHSQSVGVVIDTPRPNFNLNLDLIQHQLNRRRPGQSNITTPRDEKDKLIVLSGLENNITLGSPLCIIVNNLNVKKEDYVFNESCYIPRPSHADYTYIMKYNVHASSGGGRSSARETIGRVIAGSIAEQFMNDYNISVIAFVSQVGNIKLENIPNNLTRDLVDNYITRCPDELLNNKIEKLIQELKDNGNSIGGKITCIVKNCKVGLGEPCFDKFESLLAHAMLSIPACKGFEIGSGFNCINQLGSTHNDSWCIKDEKIGTKTNNNGGIVGGISNGEDIIFNVAFKPPATIQLDQETINLNGEEIILKAKGRHDPCVVSRAIPIVESMTSVIIYDLLLKQLSR